MVIMSCTHNLQLNGDDVHNYGRGIALEPFVHQVSGRATMMCLNETTVCKPLNYREHFFYKSLPQDIKQFAPRYKGVVNVNIEETPDGYVALTAYPYEPDSLIDDCKSDYDVSTDSSEEEQEDLQSNESTEEISEQSGNCDTRIKVRRTGSMCVDDQHHSVHTNNTTVNPWIFKVYKEGLQRQLQSKPRVVKQFILLENVTSKFRKPCVLDLKMGTRIHGDHDAEAKKMHHEIKSAQSTTQQLGVRLAGMQACRGLDASVANNDRCHFEDPCEENVLITFSTVYGHVSYRKNQNGSPFIEEMCNSLHQSHNLEIMQALAVMKHNLENRTDAPEQAKLMATTTTRLTKELILQTKTREEHMSLKVYEAPNRNRGLFLIVGDEIKFRNDVWALCEVAKFLGIDDDDVKIVCKELQYSGKIDCVGSKKEALLKKLTEYVQENCENKSCFVCAIISDANEHDKFVLEHENETYNLSEVTSLVRGSADWCGKPKLFFVQKSNASWSTERFIKKLETNETYHHPDADVLVTFSSAGLGNNQTREGISAFYEVLLQCVASDGHHEYYDLFKILTKVRKLMKEDNKDVPWTQTQLRKEIRFPKSGPITEDR
uniref:Kinase n=1 Tax=Phallusia mammillata TaxID=59560 RepID=A0A6F9DG42_9ASCI|nr:inositol hexakisphosphate kinase 1 [Phallusia mammillata]